MFIATYQVPNYFAFIPICTGKKLYCANTRAKSLGNLEDIAKKDDIFDHEALESPELIGNISKPSSIDCLPACTVQDNSNQMSTAPYPQKQNFFYQKKFCDVASHIWIATCNRWFSVGICKHKPGYKSHDLLLFQVLSLAENLF